MLKIQPELGLRVRQAPEAEGALRRDGPLAVDDLVHPRIRDAEPGCGLLLGHPEGLEKVFEEYLTGVHRTAVLREASRVHGRGTR